MSVFYDKFRPRSLHYVVFRPVALASTVLCTRIALDQGQLQGIEKKMHPTKL